MIAPRLGPLGAVGRIVLATGLLVACAREAPGTISISPTAVEVEPGATLQFTAAGTAVGGGVTWLVEGTVGGNASVGTISQGGLYQAPPVSRAPVTVTCRSARDPGVSASATVTFPPIGISVSPPEADVLLGGTQQFTATVTGAVDRRVIWTGADENGVYHAPLSGVSSPDVEVRATSVATGASGAATVHLKVPPPVVTAVTGPATAGDTVTITGSGFRAPPMFEQTETAVLFPCAGSQPIRVGSQYLSASAIAAVVPQGATTGPLSVLLRVGPLPPVRSNDVAFLRAARIRVRADRRDVAVGESVPLRVAWLGAPGPLPLAWSADAGTIAAGAYVAPASVQESTYVHVSACVEGTAVCDGAVLGLHPFVVDPDPALVAGGASIALDAHASGATANATWWRLSGGGSVSPAGVYTSSAALEDAGIAWLAASAGGVAGAFPVGVRGAVPGLLNRVFEYTDHRAAVPRGAHAETLGIAGSRLYVLARDPTGPAASGHYYWIDVYDIADPVRPAWIGAVESATHPTRLFTAQGRLYAYSPSDDTAWFDSYAGNDSTVAIYDLSGDLPVLIERHQLPHVEGGDAFDGERLFVFERPAPTSSAVGLRVYAVDGALPLVLERTTALALPGVGASFQAATAHQDRAYVSYTRVDFSHAVAAYDLSAEPPALVAEAEGGGFTLAVAGPLLFTARLPCCATLVHDRRGDSLAPVATLPQVTGWLLDAGPSRAVIRTLQSGLAVVDVSNPSAPRLSSTIISSILGGGGRLVGDLLLSSEGLGGVATWDLSSPGGLLPAGSLGVPRNEYPYPTGWFLDLLVRAPYLYAAGETSFAGGWVATYDLTSTPPGLVSYDWLADTGLALAATDALLAVGTPSRLDLHDRSSPEDPVPLSWLPIPTSFLAAEGTWVYAGTTGTELVVVDAAAPAAPVEVARLGLGGNPFTLRVLFPGVLAIAVSSEDRTDGWVAVVDVSSPATPRIRSVAPIGAPAWGLDLDGANAFVATQAGLAVVDLSDPDAPRVRSRIALQGVYPYGEAYEPAMASCVAVHEGIAYVGTFYANGMVHGFDVRDPAWPRLVSLSAHADAIGALIPALAFHGRWGFLGGPPSGPLREPPIVDALQPRNVVLHGIAPPPLQR